MMVAVKEDGGWHGVGGANISGPSAYIFHGCLEVVFVS